jgi:hypothetical protein
LAAILDTKSPGLNVFATNTSFARMASVKNSVACGLITLFTVCLLSSSALGASATAGKKATNSDIDQVVHELCERRLRFSANRPRMASGRCQYSNESPYGLKDRALIVGCLDEMETNLSNAQLKDAPFREYDLAMIKSLKRSFARDFSDDAPKGVDPNIQIFNARGQSMYRNFQWLMSRLPANTKVIVWAATTHLAKDLSGMPGHDRMVPLGSYIRREFANRSFVLGFSAYSGSYRMTRQPVHQLNVAPPLSLEGQAFAKDDSDSRYFNLNQLHKFGAVPARPTGTDFKTAKWDAVLDGLVVFREEQPPDVSTFGQLSIFSASIRRSHSYSRAGLEW